MKTETLVLVNPASGRGHAVRAKPLVESYFSTRGCAARFVESSSAEDIREKAAHAASDGYRRIVALGGDGTFHYVIEGVRGSEAAVGFLPAGSGNDLAQSLGIPPDPLRAAEALLRSEPRPMDLVRVGFSEGHEARFIGVGGMGLDAEAAHLANTRFRRWPGVTRYLAGALATFFGGQPMELRAKMDSVSWGGEALFAAVANAPAYGSGVRIAPDARMDDGQLEVVLVGPLAWTRLFEAIPIVLRSGKLDWEEIQRFRCRRAVFQANRPARVHGDGEILGEAPAEFEVEPGAIRIMIPH